MDANIFGTLVLIVGIALAAAFVIAAIASLIWVYKDSEARGKTGIMWLLIAFFTWPWGILAYYLRHDKRVQL
ncbi:MAG: hypothetical protein ABJA50_03785 [Chloroflexota bacterium]